jgi:hypothetical protein
VLEIWTSTINEFLLILLRGEKVKRTKEGNEVAKKFF